MGHAKNDDTQQPTIRDEYRTSRCPEHPVLDRIQRESVGEVRDGYRCSIPTHNRSSTSRHVHRVFYNGKVPKHDTASWTVELCTEMDQQLYAIAQQVKWSKPQELESNVLRLGGFHGMCAFIASIGKLWAAGGLKDLLVDSDVYAENTVDQMLAGKQFFRAVRGITLAYECLMQFWLSSFLEWCASEKCPSQMDTEIPHDVKQMLEAAHVSFGSIEADRRSSSDAVHYCIMRFQQHMFPLFDLFVEWACKGVANVLGTGTCS